MPHLPVIVLVRPQLGENIGAAARAMSNFGLSELRLVAPRDGWPNKKALHLAAGAEHIIEAAELFPDTAAALHDIQFAYATTARPRDIEKRVVDAADAMREAYASAKAGTRVAFVFGPERTGLENDDIGWCDTLVTIPTAPGNSSLNLAQSAVVVLYEWWKLSSRAQSRDLKDPSTRPKGLAQDDKLATKKDWQGLFEQLECYLDEADYYRVAHKKPLMWQNMRNMLLRGAWSEQEVRTFRGMLRILWEGRQPRKRK